MSVCQGLVVQFVQIASKMNVFVDTLAKMTFVVKYIHF